MGDWDRDRVVERAPSVAAHGHEDVATVLVTVKAYPAVGRKTGEAVCVAGVRLARAKAEWIRLFPVGFRDLPPDKKFEKYQVVKLKLLAATGDRRPESFKPDLDSLRVGEAIGPERGWAHRQALMESPVIAKFRYKCASSVCERGHQQTLIDWESGQLARRNYSKGPDEMVQLHRERFLDRMCGPGRDTHFYVGNMHQHPGDFLVLGLWSPPAKVAGQGTLGL